MSELQRAVLGIAVAVTLWGCGGLHRSARPGTLPTDDQHLVYWRTSMPTERLLVPAFKVAATRTGCELKSQRKAGFYAACAGVVIYVSQDRWYLERGCLVGTPIDTCDLKWREVLVNVEVEHEDWVPPASDVPATGP
jgi:hypothetical protein